MSAEARYLVRVVVTERGDDGHERTLLTETVTGCATEDDAISAAAVLWRDGAEVFEAVCTCRTCARCGAKTVCASCGQCARCDHHATDCRGCPAAYSA